RAAPEGVREGVDRRPIPAFREVGDRLERQHARIVGRVSATARAMRTLTRMPSPDTVSYRATFWRLLGFLRPYRVTLYISIALAIVSQIGSLAFPYLTGKVVTAIQHDDRARVRELIVVVLVVGVVKALCTLGRRLISGKQALGV